MRSILAVLLLAGSLGTAHAQRTSTWQEQQMQQQQLDDIQRRLERLQRAQREAEDNRQHFCNMNGIVPCF
jgi:hypothetical protein